MCIDSNDRLRNTPPEVFLGKGVLKICSKLQEKTHTEVQF